MVESTRSTEWTIRNVYPKGETVLMTGIAGHGKTYTALDQGLAVAYGMLWLGRFETSGDAVIYQPSEGRAGIGSRVRAWIDWHQPYTPPAPFYLFDERLNLSGGETYGNLREHAERTEAGLIIVDVLRDATAGVDENSAEFGDRFGALRDLSQTTGATVLVLHHLGKNASQGARGHSSVRDKTDLEVVVTSAPMGWATNDDGDKRLTWTTITLDNMPPKGKNRNHQPWSYAVDLRAIHETKPGEEDRPPVVVNEYMGGPETDTHPRVAVLGAMRAILETDTLPPLSTGLRVAAIADEMKHEKQPTDRSLKTLATDGLVTLDDSGVAHLYTLTEAGLLQTDTLPTPDEGGTSQDRRHPLQSYRLQVGGAKGDGPTTVEEMLAIQEAEDDWAASQKPADADEWE
jgi:hypothetical protein